MKKTSRGRDSDSPTCLNLILTSNEEIVENIKLLQPLGKSDHSVICFDLDCTTFKKPSKVLFKYDKANHEKMKDMMNRYLDELFPACENDIDKQWEIFEKAYKAAGNECIPPKIVKTFRK